MIRVVLQQVATRLVEVRSGGLSLSLKKAIFPSGFFSTLKLFGK